MNKKEILQQLEQRNEELYPIVFVGFKTSEELQKHRETIPTEINEYFDNQKKIKTLKWDLMTPEEQAKRLELERKIIAKKRKKGRL